LFFSNLFFEVKPFIETRENIYAINSFKKEEIIDETLFVIYFSEKIIIVHFMKFNY